MKVDLTGLTQIPDSYDSKVKEFSQQQPISMFE